VLGTCEYSNDPWASTGGMGFFDKLINCQLFNNEMLHADYVTDVPQFAKRDYKLGHVMLIHVVSCLSACLPPWNISSPTRWTVNFFYIQVLFENLSGKLKFH
jgi:hypothetical protein